MRHKAAICVKLTTKCYCMLKVKPNPPIKIFVMTFGPAQNPRKHLFHCPDTGLNKILHGLMQFFMQVIVLAHTLELISLKCSAKCGQAGISEKHADNFLFEMGLLICVWAVIWLKFHLFTAPSTDFNLLLRTQSYLNAQSLTFWPNVAGW